MSKKISYPTVDKVLSNLHYPTLDTLMEESDGISKKDLDPLDGLEPGLHIFDESVNPADTEPDMGMKGLGLQINRMGG